MDTPLIGSALMLGLMGSVHCIGMCGPLALALPPAPERLRFVASRLVYNLGRTITYAALGALVGGLGGLFAGLAGVQKTLSIVAGLAILLYVPLRHRLRLPITGLAPIAWIRNTLGRSLAPGPSGRRPLPAFLGIGMINGMLPCGLVWVALAGSVAAGNVAQGALFMALFGLGTIPLMLGTSLVGGSLIQRHRATVARVLPVLLVLLGCWFLFRGLGVPLPIPGMESELCHAPLVP